MLLTCRMAVLSAQAYFIAIRIGCRNWMLQFTVCYRRFRSLQEVLCIQMISFSLADEVKIEAAGAKTFWRFKQLMACGYRPNYEFSNEGAFWFDHPRKTFNHRTIGLYPTGTVRCLLTAGDKMTFERWEKERFAAFVLSVPSPNWWEKTRKTRHNLYGVILALFFYGTVFAIARLVAGDR